MAADAPSSELQSPCDTLEELCGSPRRLCRTWSLDTCTHILLQTWPHLARAKASALQDMAAALLPWPGPHGCLCWHHVNSPMLTSHSHHVTHKEDIYSTSAHYRKPPRAGPVLSLEACRQATMGGQGTKPPGHLEGSGELACRQEASHTDTSSRQTPASAISHLRAWVKKHADPKLRANAGLSVHVNKNSP